MSLNRVIEIGRLTKDAELKFVNEKAVVSFTIAIDDGFGDRKKTYFFNCTAWDKKAEAIANFTQKGSLIAIDGKLVQRQWEKDGQKHTVTEIVVQEVQFLDKKKEETPLSKHGVIAKELDFDSDSCPF